MLNSEPLQGLPDGLMAKIRTTWVTVFIILEHKVVNDAGSPGVVHIFKRIVILRNLIQQYPYNIAKCGTEICHAITGVDHASIRISLVRDN